MSQHIDRPARTLMNGGGLSVAYDHSLPMEIGDRIVVEVVDSAPPGLGGVLMNGIIWATDNRFYNVKGLEGTKASDKKGEMLVLEKVGHDRSVQVYEGFRQIWRIVEGEES